MVNKLIIKFYGKIIVRSNGPTIIFVHHLFFLGIQIFFEAFHHEKDLDTLFLLMDVLYTDLLFIVLLTHTYHCRLQMK